MSASCFSWNELEFIRNYLLLILRGIHLSMLNVTCKCTELRKCQMIFTTYRIIQYTRPHSFHYIHRKLHDTYQSAGPWTPKLLKKKKKKEKYNKVNQQSGLTKHLP